jgi:dihydroflavonol-4-reductase
MTETAKVLVTGGTGFLGQHLIQCLVKSGYKVKTINRSHNPEFDSLGVESFIGSVTNPDDLKKALAGCDAVFHLAGIVSRNPSKLNQMYHLHVEGTRQLILLAREMAIRRIVYISTSGAVGCSATPDLIATEETPYPVEITKNWPYYASKIKAEKTAIETAAKTAVELVIINPSLLLGPGDTRLASTVDILKLLKGQIPAIPPGGLNFSDVRDVAAGAVAALVKGRPGERYLLGGHNWTLEMLFKRVGELGGVKVPKIKMPGNLALLAANTITPFFRRLGKKSPLDPISVEMSTVFWYVDSAKAKKELGYSNRDADETLKDTIDDLKKRFSLP